MPKARFYSDTNLDGFVQLIAQMDPDHIVDFGLRSVEVSDHITGLEDIVAQWDGDIEYDY